jgi:hypothetical protein
MQGFRDVRILQRVANLVIAPVSSVNLLLVPLQDEFPVQLLGRCRVALFYLISSVKMDSRVRILTF